MDFYNPEKDEFIDWHYSKDDISGKMKCRNGLLNELGFDADNAPVIGIVSRLVKHKGIELIRSVFEEIIRNGIVKTVLILL